MRRLSVLLLLLIGVPVLAQQPGSCWGPVPGAVAPRPAVTETQAAPIRMDAQRQVDASVRIVVTMPDRIGFGSGTVLDVAGASGKDYVLTCKHVIAGGSAFVVHFPDGRQVAGKALGTSKDSDLALIEIPADPKTAKVAILAEKLPIGSTLFKVGYPNGQVKPATGNATLVSYHTETDEAQLLFRSIGGDSGGGFFDSTGRLAAVVSRGPMFDQRWTYGPHGANAQAFVNRCFASLFGPRQPPAPPLQPDAQLWNQLQTMQRELDALKARADADPARVAAVEGRLVALRDSLEAEIKAAGREAQVAQDIARAKADLARLEAAEKRQEVTEKVVNGVGLVSAPYTGPFAAVLGVAGIAVGWWAKRTRAKVEAARENLGEGKQAITLEDLEKKLAEAEAKRQAPSPQPSPHTSPTGGLLDRLGGRFSDAIDFYAELRARKTDIDEAIAKLEARLGPIANLFKKEATP